jgi:hypothetical protein
MLGAPLELMEDLQTAYNRASLPFECKQQASGPERCKKFAHANAANIAVVTEDKERKRQWDYVQVTCWLTGRFSQTAQGKKILMIFLQKSLKWLGSMFTGFRLSQMERSKQESLVQLMGDGFLKGPGTTGWLKATGYRHPTLGSCTERTAKMLAFAGMLAV